jgi:hypothetical protein
VNGLLGVDGGEGGMEDGQGILPQAVILLIVVIHDGCSSNYGVEKLRLRP